jgi:hypothetical protein
MGSGIRMMHTSLCCSTDGKFHTVLLLKKYTSQTSHQPSVRCFVFNNQMPVLEALCVLIEGSEINSTIKCSYIEIYFLSLHPKEINSRETKLRLRI